MIDALSAAFRIAGAGLEAQTTRLRVVAENIANAETTASSAGADPYRRQTVSFSSALDRASGVALVHAGRIGTDERPFRTQYDPGHPAADAQGMVKTPNVDMLVELADMREANRAYQASLQTYKQSRELYAMTIDLLKG